MKTSGLRLADSGGGAAAHTRAHNRGILADVGAKWRSPNKTHKSFKMFGSGFAPQSKRHWVGNLRPIGGALWARPSGITYQRQQQFAACRYAGQVGNRLPIGGALWARP